MERFIPEPFTAVLPVCLARISNPGLAHIVADFINPFIPIGKGWTLVAATNLGFERLVARLGGTPLLDETSKLVRLQDFNEALSMAVALGDINMAKVLVSSVPNVRVTKAIGVAARCGHLAFLKWLYEGFFDACWGGNEMTKAVRFGRLKTLKWLQFSTVRLGPQHLLGHAARHLSADVLTWVIAARDEVPELADFIVAVEHGRLENIQIMAAHAQPPPRIPAHHAARNGHIHVLAWLAVNHGVFTDEAMDAAAQNGHLDVLIWLRRNRREGCSVRATVLAAMNGHLSAIQWLVRNYPDRVSANALRIAIIHGHTKVAQWLHNAVQVN